jgi:chromate transporter
MAGVSAQLAGDALVDPVTVGILAAAGVVVWRTQISSTWLIAGGALVGILRNTAT